jgi:17beta-estradiol 17-dehydrogenase / very-long-chain 3-oxoacyl-CoA reductase
MASLVGIVGCIAILYFIFQLALWAFRTFSFKSPKIKKFTGTDNWAVVTGATAGIGEGFCEELARRKTNIVLVSRSEDKLKNVAKALEERYKIQTRIVPIDFTQTNEGSYTKLKNAINDIKVTILVNNVGVNNKFPEKFLDNPMHEQEAMINVNISSTLNVTRTVLPRMIEGKKGLVINLSSYTAVLPPPLLAIYAGTKSFINSWSIALRGEYAKDGIEVISLTPFYVKSDMTKFRKTSLTVCDGESLARSTLDSVGFPFGPASYSPYWSHAVMEFLFGLVPLFIRQKFELSAMKATSKALKRRAERDMQQKKEE